MVTGDNPLTAAAIAAEAGVDDFIAQAKPEDKLTRILAGFARGLGAGMHGNTDIGFGDGTNDELVDGTKFDVIQFKNGMHGWQQLL